jgi:hypothetical protein
METAEKLFEQAKQLNVKEVSRLIALLEAYLSAGQETSSRQRSVKGGLLRLSGIADSDFNDVSSHKLRHLANAYAPRRG